MNVKNITLGQRIQNLRKRQGLSQEALAEKLNVSRQAVSKWETGLSNPDSQNLILLARLFNVSMDELIRPEPAGPARPEKAPAQYSKPERRGKANARRLMAVLTLLVGCVGASLWFFFAGRGSEATDEAPGEYALCWTSGSHRYSIAIGIQEGKFPWKTRLSGRHTSHTSGDMPGAEFHVVDCENISVSYTRNIETGKEAITSIRAVSPDYATARGIRPGNTKSELIGAYGDALLVMPTVYSSKDDFCMYNSLYAFSEEHGCYNFVVFYMLNERISGIEMKLADDGGPAYWVDNTRIFRLLDGEPDYSQKQEPDMEELSKERRVYVALHTLLNYSLTEDDAFPYRNTIFTGLRFMDWPAYGKLGEAGKEAETIQELFEWIESQDKLTDNEMAGLQLALLSNLDGAYSEMYSHVLYDAFLKKPALFLECLGLDPDNAENSKNVVTLTVYAAAANEERLETVEAVIQKQLDLNTLSEGAVTWARLMLKRCADPYGQ